MTVGGQDAGASIDWHARSVNSITRQLGTDVASGLTHAEIADRLLTAGPNTIEEHAREQVWAVLVRQFLSPLIAVLGIAVVISVIAGERTDAVVIACIVVINGALGFAQEWRAERAIEALRKILTPQTLVRRDGQVSEIDVMTLVPGDIIELRTGMRIPADLRLAVGTAVMVDEAILTGESTAVTKDTPPAATGATMAARSSMLHAGTIMTNGVGRGIVVETGSRTELGRIVDLTETVDRVPTPLQTELGHLGRVVGVLAIAIGVAVMIMGVAAGRDTDEMLLTGISLAVAVVPEGLPAVVTVTLALGIRSMARQQALVRRLEAAEALGAATVVCTDKTGTLTSNRMSVRRAWTPEGAIHVDGTGYEPVGEITPIGPIPPSADSLAALALTAVTCNHAQLTYQGDEWRAVGDPTEAALLALAGRLDLPFEPSTPDGELPFTSTRRRMDVVVDGPDGRWVHTKGAPDAILAACTHELIGGVALEISDTRRQTIGETIDDMADGGMRTLALARHRLIDNTPVDERSVAVGLTLVGAAGILDPPRPEVPGAVTLAHRAGITVVMVTGDAGPTALAIAHEVGLHAKRILLGPEVETMSDTDLLDALDGSAVIARANPEQKLRIVRLLQGNGEVVAMTGDGVNDAPALRQAEIGVAMGGRGTDAARGASDLVLTDDNFATIIAAIREGRRQYANIRRFVRYLLSSNLGEVVAIAGNLLIGGPAILLPVQILWMNLITDGATAVALGLEQPDADLMDQPPRRPGSPILDRTSIIVVSVLGTCIGIGGLVVFEIARAANLSAATSQTLAFTSIVVFEKVNVFNFRSDRASLRRVGLFTNRWLLAAWITTLGAQVAAVYVPALQSALHTEGLAFHHWFLLLELATPLLIGGELTKSFVRTRTGPRSLAHGDAGGQPEDRPE